MRVINSFEAVKRLGKKTAMDEMSSGYWRGLASRLQSMRKGLSDEEAECGPLANKWSVVEGNGRSKMECVFLVERSPGVCVGQGH